MLVLTRRQSERIFIGNDIVVTVVRIAGNRVRVGVTAPKEIRIDREELVRKKGNKLRARPKRRL